MMMRKLLNFVSDPTLHLMVIALILFYLALSRPPAPVDMDSSSTLTFCSGCQINHFPGSPCLCSSSGKFAQVRH